MALCNLCVRGCACDSHVSAFPQTSQSSTGSACRACAATMSALWLPSTTAHVSTWCSWSSGFMCALFLTISLMRCLQFLSWSVRHTHKSASFLRSKLCTLPCRFSTKNLKTVWLSVHNLAFCPVLLTKPSAEMAAQILPSNLFGDILVPLLSWEAKTLFRSKRLHPKLRFSGFHW